MDDAKTEVKEEIRQSRLIRKSTVQELAKKKKRRKKWREAAQETLVGCGVEKLNSSVFKYLSYIINFNPAKWRKKLIK